MNISEMKTKTFWKGEAEVSGLVKDQEQSYHTTIYVKGSQLRDYSCSCAEGNSFRGPCRHAKALWEAYEKGYSQEGRPVYTDQEIRTLVREYTNREVAQIIREREEGEIRLQPLLLIDRRERRLKLEFKIGRERMYLLKDLTAFARSMENGALAEYGKSLSFHHSLEAFAPESRALAEFVVETVNTYQEYYSQFRKTAYEARPVLRELTVSRENMDRFFSMIMDRPVDASIQGGREERFFVSHLNPDFKVAVKSKSRDGISVSLKGYRFSFAGERHLYLESQGSICRCDEECSRVMGLFVEKMAPLPEQTAAVNNRDVPLFYERVLKKIERYAVIESQEIDWSRYQPEPLKARFRFESRGNGEIVMEPLLSYGDFSFCPMEDELVPRSICRDVPGEFRISQTITRYFKYKEPEGTRLVIRGDEDAVYQLLKDGIDEFRQLGEVYISDEVKKWRIRKGEGIKASVSFAGGWLDLKIEADGMSGAELAKVLGAYRQKKKYYRLKNGEFLQLESGGLLTVARLSEDLAISKTELQNGQVRLPAYRALYLDYLFKEEPGLSFYRDQLFKAVVRGMKGIEDAGYQVPSSLEPVLRGYQKYGYRWLRTLDDGHFGGILADDMGLGKTVQIIALLLAVYGSGEGKDSPPSLVVCPASLIYNWEHEFHKFAPELSVCTVAGNAAERRSLLQKAAAPGEEEIPKVFITSYDLLRRDIVLYDGLSFRFQIADEAQFIKNAGTQNARAVKKIHSQTRFALTGTPVENRLGELWSIFDYLMPGFLFSYQRFRRDFEIPAAKEGREEALRSLKRLAGPFILRRVKKDVLKELPDKLETVVYSKMGKEQRELYAASASLLKERLESGAEEGGTLQILAGLTRLRQICCDPRLCYENYKGESAKLETCMELVINGVAGGHKILLFSQFTSMLELILERLEKAGIESFLLTGDTPKEKRLHMADAFQKEGPPVFLISLKAGGTGLNLTAADTVIHYDPWWNLAAQNQATDRSHRIGQDKQVSVFQLITENTIEEGILKLQQAKDRLAGQVVEGQGITLSSLTPQEVVRLLGQ